MACYCELKTDHNCPEMLKSFEEQYEENLHKIEFDPQKVKFDPIQMQIAADINEVKANKFNSYLNEERIVKFNAVVSHFPQEFTKREKKKIYGIVLKMISKSEKYFLKNGRITFVGEMKVTIKDGKLVFGNFVLHGNSR